MAPRATPSPSARAALLPVAVAALVLGAGCHSLFLRPSFAVESRADSRSFELRTDLGAEARGLLLAAAEDMRRELEAELPLPEHAGEKREIVAFSDPRDFRRFLRAHLFTQGHAIGFYCDLGRECALAWRDPPGPEDLRVLRHELVHQHLAIRMGGRIPEWLEEGLAEELALGGSAGHAPDAPRVRGEAPSDAVNVPGSTAQHEARRALSSRGGEPRPGGRSALAPAPTGVSRPPLTLTGARGEGPDQRSCAAGGGALGEGASLRDWADYRARRLAADAIFAAIDLNERRTSWPDARSEPADAVPSPAWASGEGGYVLHLLFIRFLDAIGEGRDGALGRCLAEAERGKAAQLDLSGRFRNLGALEDDFHAYVRREGVAALSRSEADSAGPVPEPTGPGARRHAR